MKNIFKLTLLAAALVVACGMSTTASAQKFGYVNSREVVFAMPEIKQVEADMKTLQEEIMTQLEGMSVERNRKMEDYQKNQATLTDAVRQMRQEEIARVEQSIQERYTKGQEEVADAEAKLMEPLIEKARAAIEAVMKAQGLAGVFEGEALVAIDDTLMVNVTPLAKKHLGITE
jgi:outer membrane protein